MLGLLVDFSDQVEAFNLFRYITVRSSLSFILSALLCMFFCRLSVSRRRSDYLRRGELSPEVHVLAAFFLANLICANVQNSYVAIALISTILFASAGFLWDRYEFLCKVPILTAAMFVVSIFISISIPLFGPAGLSKYYFILTFPFIIEEGIDIGYWIILLNSFIIISSCLVYRISVSIDSNTSLPFTIIVLPYLVICYFGGNAVFAEYLQIQFTLGVGEYSVLLASIIGSVLAFAWFSTSLPRTRASSAASFALGFVVSFAAVITKSQVLQMFAILALGFEAIAVILRHSRSSGIRRKILGRADFLRHE